MTALAYAVYVDSIQYPAGTDHGSMPAAVVDRIRNPAAWVGGTPPALSVTPDGAARITAVDLSSATRAKKALGIEVSLLGGHIVPTGTAPVAVAQAAAGTSATATVAGRDTAGIVTLTSGSASTATGAQVIVTFNKPYTVAPVVVLGCGNAALAALHPYATATTTAMTIGFGVAAATGTAYAISYVVVGK